MRKYLTIANKVASRYYVYGWEKDDLIQEAAVAIWKAKGESPFTVARNRVINIYHSSFAEKRKVLLEAIPLPKSMEQVPDPPKTLIPPCHPWGEDPEGYDLQDPLCHNCPDKFSCLQHTEIDGLTEATIADDPEVDSVVRAIEARNAPQAKLAYEIVLERQRRRVRLRNAKQPIPEELDVKQPLVLPPAPAPKSVRSSPLGSPGAPIPCEPIPAPEGVKLPHPRTCDALDLENAISRIRIGQPFELEVGHVLVRRKKDSPDVCVEIRENGFWLNLNQETYKTPSSALRAGELLLGASPKTRNSTNSYFNIATRNNTEIRDALTGAVLASRRGHR